MQIFLEKFWKTDNFYSKLNGLKKISWIGKT